VSLVEYDGHAYVRLDGGGYEELSRSLPTSPAAGPSSAASLVGALNFQDRGPATVDGQAVEEYSAPITQSVLENLATVLGTGSGGSRLSQALSMLAPFVTVSDSAVDVWLSSSAGTLVKASVSASLTLDVGRIASALSGLAPSRPASAAALPTGTLGLTVALTVQVTKYGGTVTVPKPASVGTFSPQPASRSGFPVLPWGG
jgi:hypothetical protein